jgi:hypothetical protein
MSCRSAKPPSWGLNHKTSNMFERKFEELIAELDSATAQKLRELYATATNLQRLELIGIVAEHLDTEVVIGK